MVQSLMPKATDVDTGIANAEQLASIRESR